MYRDRSEAGKKLAARLLKYQGQNPLILVLPRGGVPVGFEIAKRLNAPLDVLVVRKLGAPAQPEYGIGAIAPGKVRILDQAAIESLGITDQEIGKIEKKEERELERRIRNYRGTNTIPNFNNKTIILVDDGSATGITAKSAIKSILKQHPLKLIIALPVCAQGAALEIRSGVRPMKDEVICLFVPEEFRAVGLWYQDFTQVSDEEVVKLLNEAKKFHFGQGNKIIPSKGISFTSP